MSNNEMIMLPREAVELAIEALFCTDSEEGSTAYKNELKAVKKLRAALERPQPDPAPYLYYDPENGDTWTHEAIIEGCCPPDGLIALYTKDKK